MSKVSIPAGGRARLLGVQGAPGLSFMGLQSARMKRKEGSMDLESFWLAFSPRMVDTHVPGACCAGGSMLILA